MAYPIEPRIFKMTRPSVFEITPLNPTDRDNTPYYQQLYQRFREAMAKGQLKPGERVPSIRSLASELNLARGTVDKAYQMLIGEGYLWPRGPAGTIVSPHLSSPPPCDNSPQRSSIQTTQQRVTAPAPNHLQPGLPALDAFPRKTWTRLMSRQLRAQTLADMAYPSTTGYPPLKQALASYLSVSRGIHCQPEQVFITAGYRGALRLITHALCLAGTTAWFEEPGYRYARISLAQAGLHLVPVPVDEEGLNLAEGLKRAPHARVAVVTPSHQSPLGMSLSLPRRQALLSWAEAQAGWIIEDDYDSEFRYQGAPLPALKSLDRAERVLYTGTFSKVLLPGLQLAYLVVPLSQVDRFTQHAQHLPGPGMTLPQATITAFMAEGGFARHLRRMRTLYAQRREALTTALEQDLGHLLSVQHQPGGIHLLTYLKPYHGATTVNPPGLDQQMATVARQRGIGIEPLSPWYLGQPNRQGFIMGFTNVEDSTMAQQHISPLRDILKR